MAVKKRHHFYGINRNEEKSQNGYNNTSESNSKRFLGYSLLTQVFPTKIEKFPIKQPHSKNTQNTVPNYNYQFVDSDNCRRKKNFVVQDNGNG